MIKAKWYVRLFVELIVLGLIGSGCVADPKDTTLQTGIAAQATSTLNVASTMPYQNTSQKTFSFQAGLSCWPIKPLQVGNNIKGSFAINHGNHPGYFYWDVNSFRAKLLADTNIDYSVPSDDKNFIPFQSENKIVLTSPEKPPITLDLPAGNYGLNSLLNGQILAAPFASIFKAPVDNEIYQKGVGYTDTYYIYDRETGQQIESHSVFLPKFIFDYAGGVWGADISYSPDGNFVLYRSTLLDGKNGYSLLDLRSNEVKWTLPESDKVMGAGDEKPYMPTWKPDASSLTYIWTSNNNNKSQNFYNISLDGTVTQFTRLEDVFQPRYILNFHPKWSSDKRYMAFKVQQPDHPLEPELFIWDDVNKTLLNPCLPVSGIEPPGSYGFNWSFDSEHIVLTLSYPPSTPSPLGTAANNWRSLILDIPNKTIYELPDGKAMNDYLHLSGDIFSYGVVDWMDWEIP